MFFLPSGSVAKGDFAFFSAMGTLYVPYHNEQPSVIVVNGHRLLLLSEDSEAFFESERLRPIQSVREFSGEDPVYELEEQVLRHIPKYSAGLVVVPPELDIDEALESLEEELPWIQ